MLDFENFGLLLRHSWTSQQLLSSC